MLSTPPCEGLDEVLQCCEHFLEDPDKVPQIVKATFL